MGQVNIQQPVTNSLVDSGQGQNATQSTEREDLSTAFVPRPEEEVIDFPLDNEDLDQILFTPIIDLKETLKASLIGVCVLAYYKKHHTLTVIHQKFLCEAILDVELRTRPDKL